MRFFCQYESISVHLYVCFPLGLSLEFAQSMFKAWLQEKDMQNVATALKKAGIEGKLLVSCLFASIR